MCYGRENAVANAASLRVRTAADRSRWGTDARYHRSPRLLVVAALQNPSRWPPRSVCSPPYHPSSWASTTSSRTCRIMRCSASYWTPAQRRRTGSVRRTWPTAEGDTQRDNTSSGRSSCTRSFPHRLATYRVDDRRARPAWLNSLNCLNDSVLICITNWIWSESGERASVLCRLSP